MNIFFKGKTDIILSFLRIFVMWSCDFRETLGTEVFMGITSMRDYPNTSPDFETSVLFGIKLQQNYKNDWIWIKL